VPYLASLLFEIPVDCDWLVILYGFILNVSIDEEGAEKARCSLKYSLSGYSRKE
jgi:hypothetical protein